jgi:tryptophanyl-tRNA synthetase
MGLFDYPVLMAADILLYKSHIVPVGEDQVPHLEFTREIARTFNATFGEIFPEPAEVLGTGAKVMGLDGENKMSKSLDNCIYLDDSFEDIGKKIGSAKTDPARKRRDDPGDPDVCNIYSYHKIFSTPEEIEHCAQGCRSAGIGCVECKKIVVAHIEETVGPLREKRTELLANPDTIRDILVAGSDRAQKIASETMAEVKSRMGLTFG